MPTVEIFTSVINSLLPEPHASLLTGMVFGVRRTMPKAFYDALIQTGTLHIIALSGQNIAIIINLIAGIILKFVSRRVSSLLTIFFIVLFILFVGSDPPVVRAGLMGGLSLISVYFGRMNYSLLSLILTSTIMLLVRPEWLSSISFQLSFGATLGIILFGGQVKKIKKQQVKPNNSNSYIKPTHSYSKLLCSSIWNAIKQDLRLTLAAQTFTVPLILFKFHRISLISPFANILIGWVVPFVTILGMIVAILGWIWLPFGMIPAWIAWVPLSYFVKVVNLTAKIPFSSLDLN